MNRISQLVSAVLLSLALGQGAWAQESDDARVWPGSGMHRGLERLDLSDKQRTAVRELMDASRQEMGVLMERRREALNALQEAQQDTRWDEKKARAKARDYGDTAAEMAFRHQKISAELRKILSAEQWQQLQDMRRDHRHQGPRDGRGAEAGHPHKGGKEKGEYRSKDGYKGKEDRKGRDRREDDGAGQR